MSVFRRHAGELVEVAPDVFMQVKRWGSNIYFLRGERLVLVDSGFPLDARRVKRLAASLDPRGPDLVIATHCHLDHMGSMARLKRAFGSRIAAHTEDADVMEGRRPYTKFRLDPLRNVYYKALAPLYPYEFVEVDVRLSDGDVIDALGGLRVVHVPGHTDGSIALFGEAAGVLFTGDTIRNEEGVLDGPPPQFTPDLEQAFDGIGRAILPLSFDILLPGHGETIDGGARASLAEMLESRKKCDP